MLALSGANATLSQPSSVSRAEDDPLRIAGGNNQQVGAGVLNPGRCRVQRSPMLLRMIPQEQRCVEHTEGTRPSAPMQVQPRLRTGPASLNLRQYDH